MSTLLPDIERYLQQTGMSPSRFGYKAARNSRLVERLRDGRRVWPETEQQVVAFMAANPAGATASPAIASAVKRNSPIARKLRRMVNRAGAAPTPERI